MRFHHTVCHCFGQLCLLLLLFYSALPIYTLIGFMSALQKAIMPDISASNQTSLPSTSLLIAHFICLLNFFVL
ncbi:hypothetical protein T4E_11488 [Trichinella pseudospiralis]|uniref:Uncharacterized protein n=1 Tax=Trichinella pseudospiralis TaxID=6337 RepID=A0A0V0YJA6_TRIPS|nr:hypothetical protein T4E_11488 [Trichinella pseudospiralis]